MESILAAYEYYGATFSYDETHFLGLEVAGFSSQGPTADGRLKPDIHAPGKCT
jgi:hypothetical protein